MSLERYRSIREELTEYSKECIEGDIVSCQKHMWACERYLKDIERDDWEYYWDEGEAQKIYKWFLHLRHTKGELAGSRIELTTWQKFVLCQLYGWREKGSGNKRFKSSFIQVGRKNAKSQMQAGALLYDMSVEATRNKEIYETYCAGTKRDQSKIILNEARNMLAGGLLEPKFKCNRTDITHRKSGSFLKPLSKEDGRKGDGTNPATLVVDEYHQHATTEFVDLALGSNSKDPLLIIITTAGVDLNAPCFTQEYKYAGEILNPDIDVINDRYFTDIHEAEEGDDISSEDTWRKANPLRMSYEGGIEKIRTAYEVARSVPDKMVAFKTKVLDIWMQGKETSYMPPDKWKACQVEEIPFPINGLDVYVGFDMSAKIDLTSVAFIVPVMYNGRNVFAVFVHSFIPSIEKLKEKEIKDKVPYLSWMERGYITVTNTQVVDQNAVMEYVEDFCRAKGLNIRKLCFDPNNSSKLMMDFEVLGYTCVEVYQSHRSLNEATVGFREEVYEENVYHEYNPVLDFAMNNAVVRISNGLIKIDKDAVSKRIDPVDAILGGYKLARYHEFEVDMSKYLEDDYLDKLYGG